jgi:hypothetical protein
MKRLPMMHCCSSGSARCELPPLVAKCWRGQARRAKRGLGENRHRTDFWLIASCHHVG